MFIVVCGISGVGKSTLIRGMNHHLLELPRSVTTRMRRESDPASEYIYVDKDAFEKLKQENKLLIHQYYHQQQYGILKSDYDFIIGFGKHAIKDIGFDGIQQLKEKIELVSCILVTAPLEALEERMRKRGDSPQQIRNRLIFYRDELRLYESIADYKITNDSDIETCKRRFGKVLEKILK